MSFEILNKNNAITVQILEPTIFTSNTQQEVDSIIKKVKNYLKDSNFKFSAEQVNDELMIHCSASFCLFKEVKCYDEEHEIEIKEFLKELKKCEIIFSPKISFAWGDSKAIKLLCVQLSAALGFQISFAQFGTDDFDNLLHRLSSVTLLKGKNNGKNQDIKSVSLNGRDIDSPFGYPDVFEAGAEITQIKGVSESFTPYPGAVLAYSARGTITIRAKEMPVVDSSDIILAYYLAKKDTDDVGLWELNHA